jgi:hypothetical protein
MRLYSPEGNLVAGGSGVTGFTNLYTGDKSQHGQPGVAMGVNSKWLIDVQATNVGASGRSYAIRCVSGSGHGGYEWVGRALPHT